MGDYDFDAPQYFDFQQPHLYEDLYSDSWFDLRTEDDDEKDSKEKDTRAVKRAVGSNSSSKPQRVLRNQTDDHENDGDEGSQPTSSGKNATQAKPRRVPINDKPVSEPTHHRNSQHSPKKKQKLSDDENHEDEAVNGNVYEHSSEENSSSPAMNTRSQTRLSQDNSPHISSLTVKEESEAPIHHEAITRPHLKSPCKRRSRSASPRKPVRSPWKNYKPSCKAVKNEHKSPAKSGNIARTGSLKRSGSLRRVPTPTSSAKCKTTEELEMERIADLKKEVARTRQKAQESYEKSKNCHGYIPVRSNQPSTCPEGFHFKTDERLKNQHVPTKETKIKGFAQSLRDALPHADHLPSKPKMQGLTKPKPFKLSSARSEASLTSKKYQTAAEKVIAFHRKTPERFRTAPKGSKPSTRARSPSPGLTMAKTPNLTSKTRSRPVHALTREEKEQMEFEEHQKQQFKAKPVNHKILDQGALGVPVMNPKPLTEIEEFNLYDKRSASCNNLNVRCDEMVIPKFKAKPVNQRMLQGTLGVKPVEPTPHTVPQSPAFALKNRVRIPVEVPHVEEKKTTVKANPVPHPGIPFRPRLEHHHTIPEPFSVEERSKRMLTRKDEKIQQALEEERRAREFHANPTPSEAPSHLPPKQKRAPVVPEPFHLSVDERGQRHKEEMAAKLEEEKRKAKEAATFKARPNHVTHSEPFVPTKSQRPLTEMSQFQLNTDQRATNRDAFDQHLKAREAQLEGQKREKEEQKERMEIEKQQEMRQAAVHKATGIKKFKSVIVKPSDKPLTNAQSPKFSQRSRRHNMSDL